MRCSSLTSFDKLSVSPPLFQTCAVTSQVGLSVAEVEVKSLSVQVDTNTLQVVEVKDIFAQPVDQLDVLQALVGPNLAVKLVDSVVTTQRQIGTRPIHHEQHQQ